MLTLHGGHRGGKSVHEGSWSIAEAFPEEVAREPRCKVTEVCKNISVSLWRM